MSKTDLAQTLTMVKSGIDKAKPLICDIEKLRGSKLVVFWCADESIDHVKCLRLLKILRRLGNIEKLDLLIESGGGDIDAACKMVRLLRQYSKSFSALVPYMAKSAATLLALNADELVMCKSGELGEVDPQVRDPATGAFVPAHSIKEAIEFIEEVKDPFVKLSLADKLPPLLIGAFRDAQNAGIQYIDEALTKLGEKKEEAVDTFTRKYLSHGYPIDRDICKEVGLNVVFPTDELEQKLGDLYECYADIMLGLIGKIKIKSFGVIQADPHLCVLLNGKDITPDYRGFELQCEQPAQSKS